MPVETDADRRLFVDADEFAVSVSWNYRSRTATFTAIFDDQYLLLSSEFVDAGAEGSAPQILTVSSDVPAHGEHDDVITISAKHYRVAEIKPDGTGMTVVRLQET